MNERDKKKFSMELFHMQQDVTKAKYVLCNEKILRGGIVEKNSHNNCFEESH